jgi:hypothetical protein
MSPSDVPVLKSTIRYASNDLLIREQLISAQKEELVLPCIKSFSVEEAENVLSFGSGLFQDGIFNPHLCLSGTVFPCL